MKFKTACLLLLIILGFNFSWSQQSGYWDKDRATSEEITVAARERIVIKTQDFPEGTTEIVFRITLLDQNQQMAGSLVSVLKSIPDPTGISQGSAGAIFLLSRISGEDKCTYSLFSKAELASKFKENGQTESACLIQENPISKDAKRLSIDKSSCLKSNTSNLWFGFESKNWIMNQKIILEVVPWVDIKSSRGWTLDKRKSIIEQCKTSNLAQKMTKSDDFCVCILDKIQSKYKYPEFQKLLAIERSKAFKDFGNACLNETAMSASVYDDIRSKAMAFIKQGKLGEAIPKLSILINEGKATALDYNAIGNCYLLTKQFGKAIKFLKEGEKKDDSELLIKLNLAHSYLLNNEYQLAKAIYKKYQNQNVTDSISWTDKLKQDFENFKTIGIRTDDFDRILNLFN